MTGRRAMTMIELLLALSLLSGFMAAVISWTQIAGNAGSRLTQSLIERNVAQTVLQLIHDDLVTGDFAKPDPRTEARPRVRVRQNTLTIETRSPSIGPITHEYRFGLIAQNLSRFERSESGRIEHPLLTGIAQFDCELYEETKELSVTLAIGNGPTLTRRYSLK